MRFSFGLVFVSAILTFTVPSQLVADDRGKLLFKDDFERNESQEETDEVGNGWGTNSKARAAGNKQVDLRDGAMYITMHKAADHAVSVTHPAEFQNGSVEFIAGNGSGGHGERVDRWREDCVVFVGGHRAPNKADVAIGGSSQRRGGRCHGLC